MSALLPRSEAEAADMLRDPACGPLHLRGGCTRLPLGPVPGLGAVLSSRRISGITRYCPDDFTLTARAGTPLAEVEAAARAAGQRLPFEPPHSAPGSSPGTPTIGAVVAMNLSGPRRPFAGDARDALLGARLVTGLGEVIGVGSGVIKNAAGLNLTRALAGSHGALGLITEVTLRLKARPDACLTLMLHGAYPQGHGPGIAGLMGQGLPLTGAAHLSGCIAQALGLGGEPAWLLRFEGNSPALRATRAALPGWAEAPVPTGPLWASIRDAAPLRPLLGQGLWRITLAPGHGSDMAAALGAAGAQTLIDWGGGLIWAAGTSPATTAAIAHLLAGRPQVRAQDLTRPSSRPASGKLHPLAERLRQALDPRGLFDTRPLAAARTL